MDDTDVVAIPGGRDVRGRLDGSTDADAVVVACPPHPQQGGDRHDPRLRAVGEALPDRLACLRIDYGPWDEGRGERRDAENAVAWARETVGTVALFGYSFGAGVALRAAGAGSVAAVSALAPAADAAEALDAIACPVQVVAGTRDGVADSGPVLERARELDHRVVELPAGHGFQGHLDAVGERVAAFLDEHC